MTQLNFTLQTLTPIFIGSGEELRKDFDFAIHDGGTYRLNSDVILEKKYRPNGSFVPGRLLDKDDFRKREFFRYLVRGTPRSEKTDARLMACIKDVYECPYIPGSSIKGAIRTALAKDKIPKCSLRLYDRIRDRGKKADNEIESALFGPDPNSDVFRALQVSDAMMATEKRRPGGGLFIANATPVSRTQAQDKSTVPIEMECVDRKIEFLGTIRFDDFLLNGTLSDRKDVFENWIAVLRKGGFERLEQLKKWYASVAGCESIVNQLSGILNLDSRLKGFDYAFLQIGNGSGWDGMTYGELLQSEDPLAFERMIKDQRILRTPNHVPSHRKIGDPFPTSRKIILNYGSVRTIFGWCLLRLEER